MSPFKSITSHSAQQILNKPRYQCRYDKVDSNTIMASNTLRKQLAVGDIIFTRISLGLFNQVADTTQSWTSHVGIVIGFDQMEPIIAESCFPLSTTTTWQRFVARSEQQRVAVKRLAHPFSERHRGQLLQAVKQRQNILYDMGFDLHSSRQFCSRFVREVVLETTGIALGQVENFDSLLNGNPDLNLAFWKVWYFGNIPWQRETVSPASMYNDAQLTTVFDGFVI